MSNSTESPRDAGGKRRRRSRGGQKRRNNNNSNTNNNNPQQEGNKPHNRNRSRSPEGTGGGNRGDQREFRPGGDRPRRRPMPPPAKLTWWQKLLKALGLYKEPARPARTPLPAKESAAAPKSNVRNARSGRGDAELADKIEKSTQDAPREARRRSPKSVNRSGGDPSSVESARIHIGNLSYDVTEQDLKELFKGIGAVRNVEIIYDRRTHRSKGFGFVEMLHIDEAKKAVEILHDQFFMGREMVVSGAQKKGLDERDDREESEPVAAKSIALAPLPPPAEPVLSEVTEVTELTDETAVLKATMPTEAAEAPVVDAPVVEAPAVEAPVVEAPAAEESVEGVASTDLVRVVPEIETGFVSSAADSEELAEPAEDEPTPAAAEPEDTPRPPTA